MYSMSTTIFVLFVGFNTFLSADGKMKRSAAGVVSYVDKIKIHKTGDLYYAASGLLTGQSLTNGKLFDTYRIVHENLLGSDFEAAKGKLKKNLTEQYLAEYKHMQQHAPWMFEKQLQLGVGKLQVVISGVVDKIPTVYVLIVLLNFNTFETLTEEHTLRPNGQVYWVSFGWDNAIISELGNFNDYNSIRRNPTAFIEKAMNIQVAATPDHTFPPFDIVKFGLNGAEWLQRPGDKAVEIQ